MSRRRRPCRASGLGLVVLGRIELQTTQWGPVEADDLDVASLDEHDDAPAPIGRSDADVVELAAIAQRHRSGQERMAHAGP